MVAIINTGKNKNLDGIHEYKIMINDKFITTFTHDRSKGLSSCLITAGHAVLYNTVVRFIERQRSVN